MKANSFSSFLWMISFCLFALQANAQNTAEGTVLSALDSTALEGVSVTIVGKATGTSTDANGDFSLNYEPGDVVEFSYVGFATLSLPAEAAVGTIYLDVADSKMDEVVVVGYGTVRRSKLTGSVAKVDGQLLESGVRANPAQALAGTVPGLRVSTGSGRPGAMPSITLRGGTNFDGSGSPLILLDGQVRGSLSDINPDDIESMEVLKDASATAIYGARASNGVILLTSKKGRAGSTSINVKVKQGWSYLNSPYNFLNAEDYIKWTRLGNVQAILNGVRAPNVLAGVGPNGTGNLYFNPSTGEPLDGNYDSRGRWSLMRLNDQNRFLLDEGWRQMKDVVPTNAAGHYDPNGEFYDLIYQEFNYGEKAFVSPAPLREYNIGFTGGNDRGRYYSNLGYYRENGLTLNTFYQRLSFVINGDYKITNWLVSESGFQYQRANWNDQTIPNGEGAFWGRMLSAPPTLREYAPNGELILGRDANDGNPLININRFERDNQTDKFTMNQAFTATITPDLRFRVNGIMYFDDSYAEAFNRDFRTGFLSYTNPNSGWNRDRSSSASFGRRLNNTINAVLNYDKTFGDHTLNAMIGAEYFSVRSRGLSASGRLAPTDDFMDLSLTQNTAENFTRGTDSYHNRERISSQFGRVNYDFQDKYLATFTVRRDGVSRLNAENRWGVFPAFSLGWIVSREDFFQGLADKMNYLKLRASWGKNGNIGIGTSNAIGLYEVQGSYFPTTPYNGVTGFTFGDPVNPYLLWEKSNTIEVGADMGFFNNRLYFSAAYYNRLTDDKLASINLPISSGIGAIRTNNGSMRNRGVELDLQARIIQRRDFRWTVNANAAWNRNTVVRLPFNGNENNRQGGDQIYDPATGQVIWVGGLQEGQEWGEVFGYVADGIIRTDRELLDYNKIDLAAGYAYDLGNAGGRRVASQGLITELGLTNYIATQLGDMRWKDIDNNDTIDFRDRVSLGRVMPRWTGGVNTNLTYKGIGLFVRVDFATGHIQRDFIQAWSLGAMQGEFNATDIVKQTWTPDNPGALYPRYSWADQLNTKNFDRPSSTFWVNSSYVALREVSLSYSLPKDWINRIRMKDFTVTATAQNLGYITNSLLNLPERTGAQGSAYTIPTQFIIGANITF